MAINSDDTNLDFVEDGRNFRPVLIFAVLLIVFGCAAWWFLDIYNKRAKNSNKTNQNSVQHQDQQISDIGSIAGNKNLVSDMMKKENTSDLGNLPRWNLGDLYKSVDTPEIEQDLIRIRTNAADFVKSYHGKVTSLLADKLLIAIQTYEGIEESIARLNAFSTLNMAIDPVSAANNALSSKIDNFTSEMMAQLSFFTSEMGKISDVKFGQLYKQSKKLLVYKPYIDHVIRFKKYRLTEAVEQYAARKSVTGRSAWIELFDELWARLRFDVNGQKLNIEQISAIMLSNDSSARQSAAYALEKVISDNAHIFTRIMNTIVNDKNIDDKIHGFTIPMSYRNIANNVDEKIVLNLIDSVKDRYSNTSHRYYRIKAKLLGKDQLPYYDRSAPLPFANNQTYTWDNAKDIVLLSYEAFSSQMADIGKRFFDRDWIDAPIVPNKTGGAFAHPTIPSVHPYIMLNYAGNHRHVSTLAHELGHGIHQILAARQGYFMSNTPLTLAETASLFGEELTFRNLLQRASDDKQRAVLLASHIEGELGAIISQIAYTEFERNLYEAMSKNGHLSTQDIDSIWIDAHKAALGDSVNLNGYEHYWMRIPHFLHAPFYVYSYAFGNLLVNALYDVYSKNSVSDFQTKYIDLLSSGGTKTYKEMFNVFGLDISKKEFWHSGIDILEKMIDDFENIVSHINGEQSSTEHETQSGVGVGTNSVDNFSRDVPQSKQLLQSDNAIKHDNSAAIELPPPSVESMNTNDGPSSQKENNATKQSSATNLTFTQPHDGEKVIRPMPIDNKRYITDS